MVGALGINTLMMSTAGCKRAVANPALPVENGGDGHKESPEESLN
jgi:hypothetical protein